VVNGCRNRGRFRLIREVLSMATTSSSSSAVLVAAGPVFSEPERRALAGFLAGYSSLTRGAYALDLRQSPLGATAAAWPCSPPAAPTSSCSAATSKPLAAPGLP